MVLFEQVLKYLYLPVTLDNLQTSLWTVFIGMFYKETVDSEVCALSRVMAWTTKTFKTVKFCGKINSSTVVSGFARRGQVNPHKSFMLSSTFSNVDTRIPTTDQ